MVKEKTALYGNSDVSKWPFMYSIENTRPADGPNSTYMVLSVLGVTGFQQLIAHLTEIAVHLENKIGETGYFEVINKSCLGTSVMFVPLLPKSFVILPQKKKLMFMMPIHQNSLKNL